MPVRTTCSVSTPASFMPIDVVEREAVEPFHHQHPRVTSSGWGRGMT